MRSLDRPLDVGVVGRAAFVEGSLDRLVDNALAGISQFAPLVDGRGTPVNKARAMVEIDDGVHAASNGVIGSLIVLCTGRPSDFSHGGSACAKTRQRRMSRT